jgi:uncharacterized membrane protein YkvA (DUF1232 family)
MQHLGRIAATVAGAHYAQSPIDLIPDFIPVLGQLDDIGVIILVVLNWLSLRNQPPETPAAAGTGADGKVIDIDPIE